MKKKRGYISIIALIIMSVLMIMGLYLGYIAKLQFSILASTKNNIQSYYMSEGKIYFSLYEEKYYKDQLCPILEETFRNKKFNLSSNTIVLDNKDLEKDDIANKVEVSFRDKDKRKELVLTTNSNHYGIETKVIGSGTIVNELFEIEKSILDQSSINYQYGNKLEKLLLKLYNEISINNCNKPENIYGIELFSFDNVYISKKDNSIFEMSSFRDTMINPYVERFDKKEIFVVLKSQEERYVKFHIGEPNSIYEDIELSGIIYVEGDIIISSNLNFNGIIIVMDGEIIIDIEDKPTIKGIVIINNKNNNDHINQNINIVYNRDYVYQYGTFLPGFIDIKLDLIKSN